jgi:hypothetical protein
MARRPYRHRSCDTRFARVWSGSIAPFVTGVLSLR